MSVSSIRVSPHPNSANLRRLVWLRWLMLAVWGAAALWVYVDLDWPVPVTPLLLLLTVSVLLNTATLWRLWRVAHGWWVTEAELAAHLIFDLAVLGAVLYFADGASNPLASLLLIPLTLAAMFLPAYATWGLALGVAGLYAWLVFHYQPLSQHPDAHAHAWWLHRLGMGLTFGVGVALIAGFVGRMAASLRQRDALLAQAREDTLRNEQILALATLAAGTAHELGTPLNTMQLLAEELHEVVPASHVEDLDLLIAQIAQCKAALTRLSARASDSVAVQPLVSALTTLLDRWQLMRPDAAPAVTWPSAAPLLNVHWPDALSQALLNLLDNAADAACRHVAVRLDWDAAHLTVRVEDDGPGVAREAAQAAGRAVFSSKGGMGVGLVLANATLQQLGGQVRLRPREVGGTRTEIDLPLRNLVVA